VFIGIDGGGSTVRVVIVQTDLTIIGQSRGGSVNPNSTGRDHAARTLQDATRAALADAGVARDAITAVGAGVAGTNNPTLGAWLRETLSSALPNVPLYTTHDIETALIGAHGERRGVIVVAGTGSAAFGVNDVGESLLVGGWGYLLGDEGSGAWIGLQALKAVIEHHQGGRETQLTARIFDLLQISAARELIDIIYQPGVPVAPRLARFAPLVLELAQADTVAANIIDLAVGWLADLVTLLSERLKLTTPAIAFGGGLLSEPNALSLQLQKKIDLPAFPQAKYPPEIGAARYAMEQMRTQL